METNACDVNQLDLDAHLPPRKRLLAGLKRQSSDVPSPAPSTSRSTPTEYDTRLHNLLRNHLSDPNLSAKEIVESSRCAAIKAAEIAEVARANAEQKAAKAAKAMAAAKSALDLVATLSKETAKKERNLKRNEMKKHVPVQALYHRKKRNSNCRTDEELAFKLHQAINSSPRILKTMPSSDSKNKKHRKSKNSTTSGGNDASNGCLLEKGNHHSTITSNGNGVVEVEAEGPMKDIDMIMVDLNTLKPSRDNRTSLVNEEGCLPSKTDKRKLENTGIEVSLKDSGMGRKRGRIRQKKLPLSICSFRDQTSPKEEKTRGEMGKATPLSAGASGDGLMPADKTSWKCQAFRAPPFVTQNKVMQP